MVLDIAQQRSVATRPHLGIAVFMMLRVFDLAAQLGRHGLHAITDPQYRHTQLEYHGRGHRCLTGSYRFGATGKNDGFGSKLADLRLLQVPAVQLTIDAGFAHATGNQLGVLGAKIEDQDAISMDIRRHEVTL